MTLYQSFRNFLRRNNISEEPSSIENSSIIFKYKNLNYVFLYDNDSPNYFRLILPRIASCERINAAELYIEALKASAEYKIAKLVLIDNQIWASFEQIILDSDADNSEIYNMGIKILSICYQRIHDFVESHQQAD